MAFKSGKATCTEDGVWDTGQPVGCADKSRQDVRRADCYKESSETTVVATVT